MILEFRINIENYKWYAVAAFVFVGVVHAFILPPHDYGFSPKISAMSLAVFVLASCFTVMAIKHTKSLAGKLAFIVLQALYLVFVVNIIVQFIESGS